MDQPDYVDPARHHHRAETPSAAEYDRRLRDLADARSAVAQAERLHRPVAEVIELRRHSVRAWLSAEACRKSAGNWQGPEGR